MNDLSAQRLRDVLRYDADTGHFFWRSRRGRKAGSRAGAVRRGYIIIGVDGSLYRAHRLAWLYQYGTFPSTDLDHANGVRDDNRISNLRLASASQNRANQKLRADSSTALKGVTFAKHCDLWRARIRYNRTAYHLGYFKSPEAAHAAYCAAAIRFAGPFARFA